MGKGLSLWFACSSILILTAASISISYSFWLAIALGILCVLNIGWGFIVKAKLRRKQELLNSDSTNELAKSPSAP